GALSGSNVDLTLLTIGSYNFTYTITDINGCTNSSTVLVTVEPAPESGTTESPAEFCLAEITTGQTFNLFDLLTGEDQTGNWNDDDATGALTGNTVALDALAEGTYNFTYNVAAIGTCDDIDVTVNIIINDTPAPVAATPQEFCDTATVSELLATGNSIQWYSEATGGSPLSGSTALVDSETYYATQIDAVTGCESSQRTEVIAIIYQSPNPGNPSALPIVECNDNNSIDLFTGLDGSQDSGGTWLDDDSTGALSGNILDATSLAAGQYQFTYYVTASAPCIDDSTTILVTIEEPLNAGSDNSLDICDDSGNIDLFPLLGGADTGGTWSPALASGTGEFDPLVDSEGTYTYTLVNACGVTSSEVVVTVTEAPNAGDDNAVTICVVDGITDLYPLLGDSAQLGGTWSPALTSNTGEFDPSIDSPGVYTYTVAAISPCSPDASAQITVSVEDSAAPIVNDPNPQFCLANDPVVADLDTSVTASGTLTWYEDASLSIVANATDALIDGEDYYVTQTNSSGCESSTSSSLVVSINDSPTPEQIDTDQELCINDDPTINDLTTNINYNSTTYSVMWYDSETSNSALSSSSLLVNMQTYYAVLVDLNTGCESSTRLPVTPDLTSCGELIIPDGFSPNGDGVNDTFNVDNLSILYPNFQLEIFNRNGNIVYKGDANTPRFNGKSNQSRTIGSGDLPVGVYFYIFNFNDGINKPKQGRLYLSR
ncbi:MAG: gliding motility-associated C-terminal domain-containing protein, partial [Winogradskyella sp.]|nr:gliding motility-associated C-terminal domain-containing protein [Winogradskyella sp.]